MQPRLRSWSGRASQINVVAHITLDTLSPLLPRVVYCMTIFSYSVGSCFNEPEIELDCSPWLIAPPVKTVKTAAKTVKTPAELRAVELSKIRIAGRYTLPIPTNCRPVPDKVHRAQRQHSSKSILSLSSRKNRSNKLNNLSSHLLFLGDSRITRYKGSQCILI